MAFGQPDSLGHFLDRGELTGAHPPPPPQCAADGAQDMGVLGLIFGAVLWCANLPLFTVSGATPKWLLLSA